jgi:hypothetical protein
MLNILANEPQRFCDALSRRRILEVGGLGTLGLSVPGLLRGTLEAGESVEASGRADGFGSAKRMILLFMWGGPAHQDTWDLKPEGPMATRGEFLPIATNVSGLQVGEHFPRIAKQADKLAIIRSVGQGDNNHLSGAYAGLTGRRHPMENRSVEAADADFPQYGSVLSKLRPNARGLPTFVSVPEMIHTTNGMITPGQGAGFLGKRYEPFQVTDHPDRHDFSIASLKLPSGVGLERLAGRRGLLEQLEQTSRLVERSAQARSLDQFYERALDMVLAPETRQAFDLGRVPEAERWRYGWHTFGQSVLMARRLIEAGVKLVTVYWHRERRTLDTTWDTHSRNFHELKDRLMPSVDRPIAALLEDLENTGLLEETLVVWNSEFGRTPKINTNAGRDHWGRCNSVVMAGGGVPGGQVFGASDRQAAYPTEDKVTQAEIAATIYHLLGLEAETRVHDRLNRPWPIALGEPIEKLLGGGCRPIAAKRPIPQRRVVEVGPFERMLRQRSNRHLSIECGNADSEKLWEIAGFSKPVGTGLDRYRQVDANGANLKYLGVFYTHFDYTHVVLRLAESRLASELKLTLRGRSIPIPDELADAGPRRLWQVPIPQGDISAIPYPLAKAFDLSITAPGWKLTGLAVVGEKIHRRHLEISGIV